MTSVVAKTCSSSTQMLPTLPVKEKGSRNKRKFRADPPLADPNRIISSTQNECTSFEFSAEKSDVIPLHGHLNGCEMCSASLNLSNSLKLDLGLSCAVGSLEFSPGRPREEVEVTDEFHDADWSDTIESQLRELVLSNLDVSIKSAIKNIVANGYTEEVATKAVLRSGLCYGSKDTISNIVDNALAYLKNGQEIDPSREHCFEDLPQMEKCILNELVSFLRKCRPFFSAGDAMWCLLLCDMNVSLACALDFDPSNGIVNDGGLNGITSVSRHSELRADAKSSENIFNSSKSSSSVCAYSCPSEIPCLESSSCSHDPLNETSTMAIVSSSKQSASFTSDELTPVNECDFTLPDLDAESIIEAAAAAAAFPMEEDLFTACRKISGVTKREYMLRQKTIHVEKHYRGYGSKGKAGKISSFGGLMLDKQLKSVPDSSTANNTSLKISKALGVGVTQDDANANFSTNTVQTPLPSFKLENVNSDPTTPGANVPLALQAVNVSPVLSTADTELSLSLHPKCHSGSVLINYNVDTPNSSCIGVPFDKNSGQWVPQDKKDEMILRLVPRMRELKNQLQEWTEWANQKVMQAARRLSKDKTELKTLKQEKEEVEQLRREKQTLEENTVKKLSEMESALCKASGQMDRANAAVRKLEVENSALRQEMEAAKLRAAETAARYMEASRREKKTLMKFHSWEKQKTVLQDELTAEKRMMTHLLLEVEQSKHIQDVYEARWCQEEKAKEELLAQVCSERKETQNIDASSKSKVDILKQKAENDLKKCKGDVERLEKEISQLRMKTDSSKIAALRIGIDGSYAGRLTEIRNASALREFQIPCMSRTLRDFYDYSGNGGVKCERECVMCLSEEMSVVFLPCAHLVVCRVCNELHEKQGMKDCPSCRSPIQQRICVRYACST